MMREWFGAGIVVVSVVGVGVGTALSGQRSGSAKQDLLSIEQLNRQDVSATLSDDADELAKLWDDNAVRLGQSGRAEVGKATIYANDRHWQATKGSARTLSYKPDIKDLQIAGDWAFDWGYFDASSQASESATPVAVHGKQLRILRRQLTLTRDQASGLVAAETAAPVGS